MNKLFFMIFVVVTIFTTAIFFYFKSQLKEQKLEHILDQVTLELSDQLKTNELDALKLAVVLSKNGALIDAMDNEDEDLGYNILSDITKSIEKDTNSHAKVQIINADYTIFARSWDNVYAGMPLGDYRTDLEYFKTHNTPRTSIEVGRRLGVKATVPLYKNGVLLGFIEVIDFFEPITEFFRSQGIDLYVLLDEKYYSTAVFMQENLMLNKYIVANRNYNAAHIEVLKNINFAQLKASRIISINGRHIFYDAMQNGAGENIGAFVLILPDKYLDYFRNPEDDISFLVNVTRSNLYDIEKNKLAKQYTMYNSPSQISHLKDIISDEDKEDFTKNAHNELQKYSKEELISLLLNDKTPKKIQGEIR